MYIPKVLFAELLALVVTNCQNQEDLQLFKWFQTSLTQLLHLGCKDRLRCGCAVYTIGLNGDNNTSTNL